MSTKTKNTKEKHSRGDLSNQRVLTSRLFIFCRNCGKKRFVKPSRIKIVKHCSTKCRREYEKKYKNVEITCITCNKKRIIPISKTKGSRGKFCTRQCFYKWHKKEMTKRNLWRHIPKTCKYKKCNIIFYITQIKKTRDYCSPKCADIGKMKYGSKEMTRIIHHRRRKALVRGGGKLTLKTVQEVYENNIKKYGMLTCILCNKSVKFGEDSLEHKTPLSKGGNNDYENLGIAHFKCNAQKHTKTLEEWNELKGGKKDGKSKKN